MYKIARLSFSLDAYYCVYSMLDEVDLVVVTVPHASLELFVPTNSVWMNFALYRTGYNL